MAKRLKLFTVTVPIKNLCPQSSCAQLHATTIGFKQMWVAPCARVLQTPNWHRPQDYRGQWLNKPTISNHLELFRTISNYFELFRTISNYFELFRTIPNYFELFRTISNYFELFRTISNYFELFRTISNYSELFRTISNYFELFLNVRIFHRLWERLNSQHKNFHCAF